MRINVIYLIRLDAGVFASGAHGLISSVAVRIGLGEVMGVRSCPVANDLTKDFRAPLLRRVQRFKAEHGRAFAQSQSIAPGIERTALSGGKRLQGIKTSEDQMT